jgi:hypothetical protein
MGRLGGKVKLQKRLERLERQWHKEQPIEITVEFMDHIIKATATDAEFARYLPALKRLPFYDELVGVPIQEDSLGDDQAEPARLSKKRTSRT